MAGQLVWNETHLGRRVYVKRAHGFVGVLSGISPVILISGTLETEVVENLLRFLDIEAPIQ